MNDAKGGFGRGSNGFSNASKELDHSRADEETGREGSDEKRSFGNQNEKGFKTEYGSRFGNGGINRSVNAKRDERDAQFELNGQLQRCEEESNFGRGKGFGNRDGDSDSRKSTDVGFREEDNSGFGQRNEYRSRKDEGSTFGMTSGRGFFNRGENSGFGNSRGLGDCKEESFGFGKSCREEGSGFERSENFGNRTENCGFGKSGGFSGRDRGDSSSTRSGIEENVDFMQNRGFGKPGGDSAPGKFRGVESHGGGDSGFYHGHREDGNGVGQNKGFGNCGINSGFGKSRGFEDRGGREFGFNRSRREQDSGSEESRDFGNRGGRDLGFRRDRREEGSGFGTYRNSGDHDGRSSGFGRGRGEGAGFGQGRGFVNRGNVSDFGKFRDSADRDRENSGFFRGRKEDSSDFGRSRAFGNRDKDSDFVMSKGFGDRDRQGSGFSRGCREEGTGFGQSGGFGSHSGDSGFGKSKGFGDQSGGFGRSWKEVRSNSEQRGFGNRSCGSDFADSKNFEGCGGVDSEFGRVRREDSGFGRSRGFGIRGEDPRCEGSRGFERCGLSNTGLETRGELRNRDQEDDASRPPLRPSYVPQDRSLEEMYEEDAKNAKYEVGDLDAPVTVTGVPQQEKEQRIIEWQNGEFEELLLKNIKKCSYAAPRRIQSAVIPLIRNGWDLLGHAETGSGKTLAFMIPIIDKIMKEGVPENTYSAPIALVIAPTRELVNQLYNQTRKISDGTGVSVAHCYGRTDVYRSIADIQKGCNILIATAGRLMDFVERRRVHFHNLRFFILDEADKMLDIDGFQRDMLDLTNYAGFPSKESRQTMLFSATFSDEIQIFAKQILKQKYAFVSNGRTTAANRRIVQNFLQVKQSEKLKTLCDILNEEKELNGDVCRTLIFVTRKVDTDTLALHLSSSGIRASSIHGGRDQDQREKALNEFRVGKTKVLVATDVCARGIDVTDLEHVVNYDLPKEWLIYVHRIGRTGRMHQGKATSFVNPVDERDRLLAPHLLRIVREAEQEAPQFLVDMAEGRGTLSGTTSSLQNSWTGFGSDSVGFTRANNESTNSETKGFGWRGFDAKPKDDGDGFGFSSEAAIKGFKDASDGSGVGFNTSGGNQFAKATISEEASKESTENNAFGNAKKVESSKNGLIGGGWIV